MIDDEAAVVPTGALLDAHGAAERLGVAARTLAEWRRRGLGPPFVKLGRRLVRYRAADLEQFIDEGRRGPAAGATR